MRELTRAEARAVAALERLARNWPRTLGIQAGTGGLVVVALDAPGRFPEPGTDWNNRRVTSVNVPAEGGDPW